MHCIDCKTETELIGDDYCPLCNEWHWRVWEKEQREAFLEIEKLQSAKSVIVLRSLAEALKKLRTTDFNNSIRRET